MDRSTAVMVDGDCIMGTRRQHRLHSSADHLICSPWQRDPRNNQQAATRRQDDAAIR